MDSKDELDIVSTCFETEENSDDCMVAMREADQKAKCIAETIMQLKIKLNDLLTKCMDGKTKEQEVCRINMLLCKLKNEYRNTVKQISESAKIANNEINNLVCKKFSFDQCIKVKNESAVAKNHDDELLAPWIVIKDVKKPKLFNYQQRNNESTDNESFCSCNNEPEENVCSDSVDNTVTNNCCEIFKKQDTDYEKQEIRDDLMATMGEVKLLDRQNRDLLCHLNTANQQTIVLSNIIGQNMSLCKNNEKSTDTNCSVTEIQSSHSEEDRMKLEELTDEYNSVLFDRDIKLEEIADLRKQLEATIRDSKTYQDCLVISETRITLLESELFALKSSKSHDTESTHSNEKYLIENLKHRLFEAKAEINNMHMVLDYHLTELEDKKAKYLEVLQTHHEQKCRIETLSNEKNKISKEYEVEFNRMDVNLKERLIEIGNTPVQLASVQQDFEKEKFARMVLEKERNTLLRDIDSLKASLALENNAEKDKIIEDFKEKNKQLDATVMNLKNNLKENERLYTERTHYALQLNDLINAVREDAAVQVTKIKDFSECQKHKYTEYIQRLEKHLAESRAIACSEFKKRDRVDDILKNRIEILTKNLNEANLKIAEVVHVKKIINNNSREELCKIPVILNSICEN